MVELVRITGDNWRAAARVRVGPGQLRFIAGHEPVALVILSKAFVRVGDVDWWPFLIEDAGAPVGVLALTDERARAGQLGLFHLLIDREHQGRGFGRAALRAVAELARRTPGCARLRLTVHPDNRAAIGLYRSEGFVEDGLDGDGELRMLAERPG